MVEQRINSEEQIKVLCEAHERPTGHSVAPVKGIREPHEERENYFDLGGNRTHDLRSRSTVTLPIELRSRTEKVGNDFKGGESRRRESKSTYECCAAQHYEHKWSNRELTLKCKLKCYVKLMKDPLGVSPSKELILVKC